MYVHALTSSIVMSTTLDDTKVTLLTLNAPEPQTEHTINSIIIILVRYNIRNYTVELPDTLYYGHT